MRSLELKRESSAVEPEDVVDRREWDFFNSFLFFILMLFFPKLQQPLYLVLFRKIPMNYSLKKVFRFLSLEIRQQVFEHDCSF